MSDATEIVEKIKDWVLGNKSVVLLIFKSIVEGTANPYDDKLYEFVEFLLSNDEGGGWFSLAIAEGKADKLPQELFTEADAAGFDPNSMAAGINAVAPTLNSLSKLVNG